MPSGLRRFFDVRAGEGVPVLLSFLYVACVVAAFLLAKPLRNSLYLREYGPYALAYAYVAVPVVLSLFVPLYAAVAGRVGTRRATFGTLVFFALNVVWFWWAFRFANIELLPAAFYVWVNCFGIVAPVQAWSVANSLFDARQARRLFGVIGAGASLGAIAGGVLARFLVVPVGGTVNLLLVLAALILSAAMIVALASPLLATRRTTPRRRGVRRPFAHTLRDIASRRYLRLLTALVVVAAIATQWTAFQLSLVASVRFGDDADALTRFFGTFNFTLGAIGLVLQLLLTSRILRRFGVGAVIVALPVAIACGSAVTVLVPVFLAVLLTNAADQSLRFSVDKVAYELLYLPLAPAERPAIKNALDILANRIGDAAGGLLLGAVTGGFFLLPGLGLGLRGIAAITCGMALVWGAVAWRLRYAYVAAIGESIHRHRIDVERALEPDGPSPHATVVAALASADVHVVREGLSALMRMKTPEASPELFALLRHDADDVRRDALAVLAETGNRTAARLAEAMLHDADPSVRTRALLYLARDGDIDPLRPDAPLDLDAFERYAIRAAIAARLAAPGAARNDEAACVLVEQMAASDDARERVEAARVLCMIDAPPPSLVKALVADPDVDVVRQAIRTAEARPRPECLEVLLALLARPEVADDAVAALAAYGPAVVPRLEAALADATLSLEARRELPAVLVRIGTPEAERALAAGLVAADAPLRHHVIASLNKLTQRYPQVRVDPATVELLLVAEIVGHYRSYQVLMTLRRDDPVATALRQSMELEAERIFRLMALLSPGRALHDAYVGIRSDNDLVRANALEYLDNVLPPQLRDVLLPLFDVHVTEAERAALVETLLGVPQASPDQAVATLLSSGDPWLRAQAETAFLHVGDAPVGLEDHPPAPASIQGGAGAG